MGSQIPKGKQLDIFFKTQLPSKTRALDGELEGREAAAGEPEGPPSPNVEAHHAGPSQQGDTAGTAGQDPPLSDLEDPTHSDRYQ